MNNMSITPDQVRNHLLNMYAGQIALAGRKPDEISDDFDLFLEGVIDSLGVLEMVGSLEKRFGIQLDMSAIDVEQITVIGPLSNYVAAQAGTQDGAPNATGVPEE
jgi:acyl carrier protein